ncbi:MAG: mechanosensitive ion channel family protein [Planctomycetota bacterium]|jgi:small-conductance mechanosensitive channel
MHRLILSVAVLQLLVLLSPFNSLAQVPLPEAATEAPVTLPDPLTPEAVRELVSRLSDAEVRALLLQRLDAVAAKAEGAARDGGLLDFAQKATIGVIDSARDAFSRLTLIWETQGRSLATFWERVGSEGLLIMAVVLIGGVVGGLAAEWVFGRATRRWHTPAATGGPETQGRSLRFLFGRFVAEILGVVVFFYVARWVGMQIGFGLFSDRPVIHKLGGYLGLIWINLIVIPRFAAAFSRFLLAPYKPEFRLVHADDATAWLIHRNWIGLVLLVSFNSALFTFTTFNGVGLGEARLGFWLNLAMHLYIILIALWAKDGLVRMMRGSDPDLTATEERVARAYPWFIVGVSVGTWWLVEVIVAYGRFDLLRTNPHFWMMVVLIVGPLMDMMVRGLARHLVPPMTGEGALAEKAYHATKRSYIRIGRVLVFAAVIVVITWIWPVDFHDIAGGGIGVLLAARLIEILMILAAGYLLWEVFSLWVNRKLAAEITAAATDATEEEPGGGEGGGAGGTRLSTVLPLLLGVAKVAFAVIFGLIALGQIGIDITPLLAGAGIVGLAIGFGAQKLVTDVVSGIFFLVDDAFRVGEFVDVEGTVGTVEKISVRSMQLRHHKGPVHTIPYGEIPKLTNYSRDWVIMKLKFTVPFETDPNKVKKLFKQIGKDMMEVPEFAADLLQPFKSQGVFDFDDVGMIIRGKFMAKPGRQFVLRKEIYNRVKRAFEENDIPFARREVRVALPAGTAPSDLTEEQKAAITAAAVDTTRKEDPPPGAP